MTLKVERFQTRVRLSEEMRSEHLDQVQTEIDCCGTSAVFGRRGSGSCRRRLRVSCGLPFGNLQYQRRIDVERIDQSNEWKGAAQNDRRNN